MHLVIDGYNLIHACGDLFPIHDQNASRQGLTAALKLYRNIKKHRITVVFDGGEIAGGNRESMNGVPVVYSGPDSTADDAIVEMCRRQGPGLTVITDDRELTTRCHAHGSEVIASRIFVDRLWLAAMDILPNADLVENEGWDFTTKKKGPSKREPKARRRRKRQMDNI